MEQYLWIIWLVIFIAMLVVEASSPALVSIWFAVGALITLIISFIPGVPYWVEIIVFVAISASTLLALRPMFKRFLKRDIYKSNVDSIEGKRGFVVEEISELSPGSIKIGDIKWSAVPLNKDETLHINDVVEVVSINGNKLTVKKVEEKK